jgi:hypothetical protein
MVQQMQINKHIIAHKQNKGQKPHDHLIDAEKPMTKLNTLS